jgi:hypothetical protein
MNQEEDSLRDRLRKEAAVERPPFSAEIHQQILRLIRNRRPGSESPRRIKVSGWLIGAAAGMCLIVGALSVDWFARTHKAQSPVKIAVSPQPKIQAVRQTAMVAPRGLASLTLIVDGVISGRLWPPEITVRLPLAGGGGPLRDERDAAPQVNVSEPLGSPEWLLDRLQYPARSSLTALAGVIPPDVRALAALTKLQR